MITAASQEMLTQRQRTKGKLAEEYWRTEFIGRRGEGVVREEPQGYLVEMSPNQAVAPHFHAVDQFQVFVAGAGEFGRDHKVCPLSVHYADHHTGYGPIVAGPQGFSYFTLRARTDPGVVFLNTPGYREKLQPSRKRHGVAEGITLSTAPVLRSRVDASVDDLLTDLDSTDGLGAKLFRIGPGVTERAPDPSRSGGQFFLVVNGDLVLGGRSYATWSLVFVAPSEASLALTGGEAGTEVLMLQYPVRLGNPS
jgi:hypothetical protein